MSQLCRCYPPWQRTPAALTIFRLVSNDIWRPYATLPIDMANEALSLVETSNANAGEEVYRIMSFVDGS